MELYCTVLYHCTPVWELYNPLSTEHCMTLSHHRGGLAVYFVQIVRTLPHPSRQEWWKLSCYDNQDLKWMQVGRGGGGGPTVLYCTTIHSHYCVLFRTCRHQGSVRTTKTRDGQMRPFLNLYSQHFPELSINNDEIKNAYNEKRLVNCQSTRD